MKKELLGSVLRRNISPLQLLGFILSNFIGLAIVIAGLQFYEDVRALWEDEDSFIKKDYIVVNKRVTSANTLGESSSAFTEGEIADLEAQPWVRKVGRFASIDYKVSARVEQGGRGMSTYLFFEALPDEFVDVSGGAWHFKPGDTEIPIIMSKDYLALYNFGFAGSAGLPQMSESVMGSIPLELTLQGGPGRGTVAFHGRVVGFSNRLNTILVPQSFMDWSNSLLGEGGGKMPSRLIVDVSSPGDTAISRYMEDHDLEIAGDKSNSQASFLLSIIVGVVLTVGGIITVLSLFVLLLSVSLLLQKNREKLHQLLELGFDFRAVERPYIRIVTVASVASYALALVAMYIGRAMYLPSLGGLLHTSPNVWLAPLVGLGLTVISVGVNIMSVKRQVKGAYRK